MTSMLEVSGDNRLDVINENKSNAVIFYKKKGINSFKKGRVSKNVCRCGYGYHLNKYSASVSMPGCDHEHGGWENLFNN